MRRLRSRVVAPGVLLGTAIAGRSAVRRLRRADLRGEVVLITGGSRGLGLAMAREFGKLGCRIAICGRDEASLFRARDELDAAGVDVLAIPCDVADRTQVDHLVASATERFGQIDILVANAGEITVGPFATTDEADYRRAFDVMFWGTLRPVWAVLPAMQARGKGRIVAITSVGGKVSIPHLLPYAAAKFAAVGLSEGLRAELAGTGVQVTTVAPGLLRTGSYRNVEYRGRPSAEFSLFALGANLPLVTMGAEQAARQVVAATIRGDAEVVLSLPAAVLTRVHGLFPGLTTEVLGVVNRLLPDAPADGGSRERGHVIEGRVQSKPLEFVTRRGRQTAATFNQIPPPATAEGPTQ